MSYETQGAPVGDYNYLRYAGWSENNDCTKKYYSQETINTIQKKVKELTREKGKSYLVPAAQIAKVMDGIYQNFRPNVGDIYSRYVVPNDEQANMVQSMIDQTIEVLTDYIRNEYGMQNQNEKLSPWVQLYGDFNPHNLTQTPPIKLRYKRPATMQFNINY